MSGQVDYEDNWQRFESPESVEVEFPRDVGRR